MDPEVLAVTGPMLALDGHAEQFGKAQCRSRRNTFCRL